jgi:GT2 family glycosyltransferase
MTHAASQQESPFATVIIPTRNRREDVLEVLASLADDGANAPPFEVIVVDDASTDGTAEAVSQAFPWVRCETLGHSVGPAHARNHAAAIAGGSLLLFLDSDGVVARGWGKAMLDAAAPDTVLLGCAVDFEGGRVQSLPRRATFLGKSLKCTPERANTGPSCNLGVPQAAFHAVGGFDEELPYYFEDSDLCIRLRRAGYRFRYVPDAVFRHKGTERKRGDAIRMQERNSTYAMLKTYRREPIAWMAFSVLNGLWLAVRMLLWSLRGRFADCARLLRGWGMAYARFWGWAE